MAKISAGLLMYRRGSSAAEQPGPLDGLEVFLAHPGGPFFANKDDGSWTLPKGEPERDEALLACAQREFREETGMAANAREFLALGEIKQAGGKTVHAWAFEGEWNERELAGNHFELEWPPRSGKKRSFPEIDRVQFFSIAAARNKLNPAQTLFLDRLIALLG